jgi:hypothetical protein
MKLIFHFPDDTAFFPGIGRDVYENFPEIRKQLNRLRLFARVDVKEFIYPENKEEWSKDTKNLAVLISCAAIYTAWSRKTGFTADLMYGKDIGGICALVCKRKLSLLHAVRRVRSGKMSNPFYISESDCIHDSYSKTLEDNVIIDFFMPQNQSIEEIQRKHTEGLHIYLDDPQDSSFVLDNILEKKLFNYLYASRRLQGIAVACQNHAESPQAFELVDTAYKELSEKVRTGLKNQHENGETVDEQFFIECTGLLERILEAKKVDKNDVSGQLLRLQNETAINMRQYLGTWI